MTLQWYLARNKQKLGPFSPAQLQQLALCRFLQPDDMIWADGTSKWVAAATLPGLFRKPEKTKYWLQLKGQTRGPYEPEQVVAGITSGEATAETLAYSDKDKQWKALAKFPEFANTVPPTSISRSSAQLLAGTLDWEEASLHVAGKEGDEMARLMSFLMELKRTHKDKPDVVESLDRSLEVLRAQREQKKSGSGT